MTPKILSSVMESVERAMVGSNERPARPTPAEIQALIRDLFALSNRVPEHEVCSKAIDALMTLSVDLGYANARIKVLVEELDMLKPVAIELRKERNRLIDELSYADLRASGGLPEATAPTDDLVNRFAAALKEKLHAAEQKYGFSNDWMKDDWQGELIAKLLNHVQKGDPRDVAAYCAFAWHHGWSITPYTHTNSRRAIRELKLIATAEVDQKVREGIDRAIRHLESMLED